MSFVRILMSVPDSCQTMRSILQLEPAPINQVDDENLDKLIGNMIDGSQASYTKIATCLAQATGSFTFSGLLAGDTITVGGTAAPTPGPVGPTLGNNLTVGTLGGSGSITNTGTTTIHGDLALSPGSSVTGSPIVTGTSHVDDSFAIQARTDFLNAAVTLGAMTANIDLTGTDLGGLTLTPGVYKFTTTAAITGTLTLDGQNNPNALFVFQVGTAITTATAAHVVLINGANANNVFWNLGSAATLGTGTTMQGNILAQTSITFVTGSTLVGRALAKVSLTLDTNTITVPTAVVPALGTGTTFTAEVSPVGTQQFALGASDIAAALNAAVKINALLGTMVSASAVGNVITITAVSPGTLGNLVILSSSNGTRAAVVTMAGGSDGVEAAINYGYGAH
jgi:hypothetical protein